MKLAKTVAGISLLALVLVGCDSPSSQYVDNAHPSGTSTVSVQQQFDQLMQRPSLEETTSHYEEMRQKIADSLTSNLGISNWNKRDGQPETDGCGSGYSVDSWDGRTYYAQALFSKIPVAYTQWQQAKSLVSGIATFGSAVNTIISFRTGCHLTDEAKKRGQPRPTS